MSGDTIDQVLVSIRRIFRAVDLHSKKLIQHHGLTVPQLLILREAARQQTATVGALARGVSLSQATVTNIIIRLERNGLLTRTRSDQDKRRVIVTVTDRGEELLTRAPSMLHDRFIQRFGELKPWEQSQLLSSVQRLAELMDAEDLEAAPVLLPDPTLDDNGRADPPGDTIQPSNQEMNDR